MFVFAVLGYIIFAGWPALVPHLEDDKLGKSEKTAQCASAVFSSEVERAFKEIQRRFESANHRGVVSLWPVVARGDISPGAVIYYVVESMRHLGRSTQGIVQDLKKSLEQNKVLRDDVEGLCQLCEDLARDARSELLEALLKTFQAIDLDSRVTEAAAECAITAYLASGNHEAAQRIASMAGVRLSLKMTATILAAQARAGAMAPNEALQRLTMRQIRSPVLPAGFAEALVQAAIALDAKAENPFALPTLFQELNRAGLVPGRGSIPAEVFMSALDAAIQREDTVTCREVDALLVRLQVTRDVPLLILLLKGLGHVDSVRTCEVALEASTLGARFSEDVALTILSACSHTRRGGLVAVVHRSIASEPGFVIYEALIHACSSCGLSTEACDFYDEMKARGVVPDFALTFELLECAVSAGRLTVAKTLGSRLPSTERRNRLLILAHGRARDSAGAEAIFRQWEAPSRVLFEALLEACAESGDADRSERILAEAQRHGTSSQACQRFHLRALTASGRGEEATSMLSLGAGTTKDRPAYHEILRALSLDKAWSLIAEMQRTGSAAAPNAATASILLQAVNRRTTQAEAERALQWSEQMAADSGDELLLANIIEACARLGTNAALKRARNCIARAGAKAIPEAARAALLRLYGRAGDAEGAFALWSEMQRSGAPLTSVDLSSMADALVACGKMKEALVLLQEAPQGIANVVTFSSVMKGFAHAGQAQECFAVYENMKQAGVKGNLVTFNTLVDACARGQQMNRLNEVLSEISKLGLEPDLVTYATALKGLCAEQKVDEALALFDRMHAAGIRSTDEILYNGLLNACASQRRGNDALKLFKVMEEESVQPSNYTLCALVKVLGRSNRLDDAIAMVQDLPKKYCFEPNLQVYTCLLSAVCFVKRVRQALILHDEMIARGVNPDAKTYDVLAKGCLRANDAQAAVEVLVTAFGLEANSRLQRPAKAPGMESAAVAEIAATLRAKGVGSEVLDVLQAKGTFSSCQMRPVRANAARGRGRGA
jgi:pentatricopeptide repeat protein